MSANVSRRSVAKGAAWAAPAVIATSAVPAYAASSTAVCSATAVIGASGTLTTFNYGTPAYNRATGEYTSQATKGSWSIDKSYITIDGLEADETIVKMKLQLAVENRTVNSDSTSGSTFYDPTSAGATYSYPVNGDGWSFDGATPASHQRITVNGLTHEADMWTVTFNHTGAGDYTGDSAGDCREFSSSDLVNEEPEGFIYTYNNIMSLSVPTPDNGFYPNHAVTTVVTTSKGRTLTLKQLVLANGMIVEQESVLS